MQAGETTLKTLYVGNLDYSVSEDLLCALFSQIGNVRGCKVIREKRTRSQKILAQASARCARVAKSARAHPRGSDPRTLVLRNSKSDLPIDTDPRSSSGSSDHWQCKEHEKGANESRLAKIAAKF
ncbi:uncharacterized protein LOC124185440 isoform X2 [Neodiprion fabricii]|uniref:uncharacterized protein LOC124185440 isoform X2 n=1 Tax=Neodiprion fabricii TaxID=2872261 RepID=UPI001ED8CB3A|nr:uncharacterized protein LOC124185440 isoform X2 [Neodiprion fabricii]